jgi:hypothetical protein
MTQAEVNAIKEFAEEHFCNPYMIAEEWEACKDNYEEINDYLYDLEITGNYDVFQDNSLEM